jgi:DNA-binding transcriptional regulator YhcF (GntR family)
VIVRIESNSPLPPYEQLRGQVAKMIASGQLAAGHQLPSIRQLAADLQLAPGTVARAYRELESAGWVRSAGRRGTRVADRQPAVETASIADQLDDAARSFAVVAVQLGATPHEALDAAQRALAAVDPAEARVTT